MRHFLLILVVFIGGCTTPSSTQPDAGTEAELPDTIAASNTDLSLIDQDLGIEVIGNEALVYPVMGSTDEDAARAFRVLGFEVVGRIPDVHLFQLRFDNPTKATSVLSERLEQLRADPSVATASPNYLTTDSGCSSNEVYPDDGYSWEGQNDDCGSEECWSQFHIVNQTWGLQKICMPAAWSIAQGVVGTKIGIVDSFFDIEHSDLSENIELVINLQTRTKNIPPDPTHTYHGTHVSGIAASACDNGQGIAGVACGSSLILAHNGSNQVASDIEGLIWTINRGAKVINYSKAYQPNGFPRDTLSSGTSYEVFEAASLDLWQPVLDNIARRRVLLIAAAGNANACNQDLSYRVEARWSGGPQTLRNYYPDNIIVVASIGNPDRPTPCPAPEPYFDQWSTEWSYLSHYSQSGDHVDVAAPGASILSTVPVNADHPTGVEYMSGTSMAAPFVTGLASLVWGMRPELEPGEVKERILRGARLGGVQVVSRDEPGSETISRHPFYVINSYQTLRAIDLEEGCDDHDGDGYGRGAGCLGLDCDDESAEARPPQTRMELCDGVDNNCNGYVDEEGICAGAVAGALVSGVVPGVFSTNGGTFQISVSPIDPSGELIIAGVRESSFSFIDMQVSDEASGALVTTADVTVDSIEIIEPRDPGAGASAVLVFDSSGSMSENDPRRLRVDAGRQYMGLMRAGDETAIMDFGSSIDPGHRATRLLSDFTSDHDTLFYALDQVTVDGGTPLYDAVLDAMDLHVAHGGSNQVALVLTDGQANEDQSLSSAIAGAQAAGIPVFPIGLGTAIDFSGLQALARETGGTFAHATDAIALAGLFEALGLATTAGRIVVYGSGEFHASLLSGRYEISGVLRTSIGGRTVDTPFSFVVDIT